MRFAVDARQRVRHDVGEMHHGRASILLRVLGDSKVRTRLHRDVVSALRVVVRCPAGPEDPDRVAGTLALCVMAGVPVERELRASRATSPWHAAQVVAALGAQAPNELWRMCVAIS